MVGQAWLTVLAATSIVFSVRAESLGMSPPGLAPGQQWSIKSTSPTTAKVIIDRLEPWHGKTAVHISIIDLPVPQGLRGAGGTTVVTHMPFEQSALAASLDRLLATGVSPPSGFESGYKSWHDANGGIFTVSVEKAIEFTLQTLAEGQSPR
jgi:hypothetical protein